MGTDNTTLRVLVIEDEGLIRWAVTQALTAAGHRVVEAATGATALKVVADAGPIDVILLDFRLPDTNGLTLCAELRQRSPETAIVMMTASGTPEALAGARALGVYDVMAKPFDVTLVGPVVRKAYEARPH